jgi:hypothetical protein
MQVGGEPQSPASNTNLYSCFQAEREREREEYVYVKSRVEDCCRTGSRRIRTDIGEFSFANRTIAGWNRLPEGAIGTPLVKTHQFRNRVRKVPYISEVKWRVETWSG